ncbi:unnamed protein product [Camellia sinensis]
MDEKDRKMQELTAELQNKKQLCSLYQRPKVQIVVNNLKEFEPIELHGDHSNRRTQRETMQKFVHLWGIYRGLIVIFQKGYIDVLIESDSAKAVELLQNCADKLAKLGADQEEHLVVMEDPPEEGP